MRRHAALLLLGIGLVSPHLALRSQGSIELRPRPQVLHTTEGRFSPTAGTRIVIPKGWPPYVAASAEEVASVFAAATGVRPPVVEVDAPDVRKGDVTVAFHDWLRPHMPWVEAGPLALVRPAPSEGYNIRIGPGHVFVAGNSPRACFLGLQTLIQIAGRSVGEEAGAFSLPGLLIADWPDHAWRTLQLPFGVYGSTYDRGEHRYRHITKADLTHRAVRLAAHHKLTGLVVEVGCGMEYARRPEVFVEGFATNAEDDVRAAADLAISLGVELVPFLNASGAHDIWLAPYPYAVPDTDLYLEALFDTIDECLEVMRPATFHIGMDEDVATDFDGVPRRDAQTHREVMLACHEFLRRRGVATLVWNDGISILGPGADGIPRDIVVMPWLYGGSDFTSAQSYVDLGFRILCSPWSQWHVENDQFFSLYAATLNEDRVLGMAGTIWYPVPPEAETDYRRCLVKAADAFWNPRGASDYPDSPSYPAPAYDALPADLLARRVPRAIPAQEIGECVARVTAPEGDAFACEAARERLVGAGTTVVSPLLEAMARTPEHVSPWAEGTLRRIVRDPVGDPASMTAALSKAAEVGASLRALALEMLAATGDDAFLEGLDPGDPAVCFALGRSGRSRFLPALLDIASQEGAARAAALQAIDDLRGIDALLGLVDAWPSYSDEDKEAFAKAVVAQANDRLIPLLDALAQDADWRVRFRAAIGLGATRSEAAGPALLALLDDPNPAVFKTALYWCTDTHILPPEAYFPRLVSRLRIDEPPEIVKPIVHALALMWDPARGQWLAKGEDPARRIGYEALSVWEDPALEGALQDLLGYRDVRLATDALVVLTLMGRPPAAETIVANVDRFTIEDLRWFCVRLRDMRRPDTAPVFARLWRNDDRLVRNFILQYCGSVVTPETFEIAWNGFPDIPEEDEHLRDVAVYTMAAHVTALDDNARRAIPLILDLYARTAWIDGRRTLDTALCRAAGQEPPETLSIDPEDHERRVDSWRRRWESQSGSGDPY